MISPVVVEVRWELQFSQRGDEKFTCATSCSRTTRTFELSPMLLLCPSPLLPFALLVSWMSNVLRPGKAPSSDVYGWMEFPQRQVSHRFKAESGNNHSRLYKDSNH